MLAALLASGLSLGQRVWQDSEERAQAARAAFDVETALRRLLENMQPLRTNVQTSQAIEFSGNADELDGIVPLPLETGLGGLYRLHLFRDRGARRLDLSFHTYERGSPRPNDDEAGLTTLADNIDGLELRYFGKAKGEESETWRSDWQGQEELPTFIAIRVANAKVGIAWPELLIAPRVRPVDWR
jgi:hypothetical protein